LLTNAYAETERLKKLAKSQNAGLVALVKNIIHGMEPNKNAWDQESTFQTPEKIVEFQLT
jgi:hypothetical protein